MISRLMGRVFLVIFLSISYLHAEDVPAKPVPQQQAGNQELDAMQGLFGAMLGQQMGGAQGQANPMAMADAQKVLQQFIQSAMQKRLEGEMKKRSLALKTLTEEEQKIVMEAHDAYQSITQIVSIPQTLTKLCTTVREMVKKSLEQLTKQNPSELAQKEYLIKLDLSLEKLHEALLSGTFKNILKSMVGGSQGGLSPEMMMNPELLMDKLAQTMPSENANELTDYASEDLNLVCELLQIRSKYHWECFHPIKMHAGDEQNLKEYSLLLKSLEALKASDMILLAHLIFEHNAPAIDAAYKQLEYASKLLNDKFHEAVGMDVKDFIKEVQRAKVAIPALPVRSIALHHDAYVYWYREMKKYAQTISTFNELKQSAQLERGESSVSSMELFRNLAYACDFGTSFLDLYNREHKSHGFTKTDARLLVPFALDWSIRGGMSFWYCREMQAKLLRGSALQVAVGESSLAAQSQMQMMLSRWGAIAMAVPILWRPSVYFKKPGDFALGASKIFAAWSYYHTAHMALFEKDKSKRELWPSGNKYLVESLKYAAHMTTHSISSELAWQVRRNVGHETLETLGNYSWGVIDPEMIHEIMDTMIPYIFLNLPKSIVNTNRSTMYGGWYEDGVNDAFMREFKKDPNNVRFESYRKKLVEAGHKGVSSKEILDTYYEASNLGSVDGYYVEHMFVDYVASSIGRYWGRRITLAFKGPVVNLCNKVVDLGMDCLETVGLISPENAEGILMWRDSISEDMDVVISHLKELVIMGVGNESPYRPMLLPYLIEFGYLDKDETDESEINRSITQLILSQLVVNHLFTNSQAAEIIQACDNSTDDVFLLEPAVDKIIEGLRDSVIGLCGGMVGSHILKNFADVLCWHYGPFYPKIKSAFSR